MLLKGRAPSIVLALVLSACGACPVMAGGKTPIYKGPPLAVKPPLPLTPCDFETITDRTPTFRFNGRYEADRYRVELARDDLFTDPVVMTDREIVEPSGITPICAARYQGDPLADGTYYWRVFAAKSDGDWTPPANYRKFFVSGEDRDAIAIPDDLVHPRLLIRADEIESFKQRIERNEHLRRGWQYQLNAAYGNLELTAPDESYAVGGKGQHGNYATAAGFYSRHLVNLGVVALVTGEQKFADKGVEMLMTACSYERWLGHDFENTEHFDPPWHSALETAMMTEAIAHGYDLFYHHLTEAQRETVRNALVDKGIRRLVNDWADPMGSSRVPRHQIPSGNWVMVCAGSGGVGALALLGEHPEAAQWTRIVSNRVRAWFEDRGGDWFVDNPYARNRPDPIPVIGPSDGNFGVDGGYKETIGYMNYGTGYALIFADALRRTTKQNLFVHVHDKLLDHFAWSLMGRPVEGGLEFRMIDFGDEGGNAVWFANLEALMTKNRAGGLAAWLYRRTIPVPLSVRTMLYYDENLPETPPDVSVPMGIWRTVGHVVMRSGWSPAAPLAAIKFRQNRGHHEIGQVYLYGADQPTLIDSGSTHYGSPIYQKYLSKSVAHNVVLVDGKNQVRTDGEMLAAVGTAKVTAASGQLQAAYPKELESWTRDLVMLPDGIAVVYDELQGKGGHRYDLVLQPENPYEMTGPTSLKIGKALVDVHTKLAVEPVEQDGYFKTLPRKYLRFNGTDSTDIGSFLTVCRWPTGDAATPADVKATTADHRRHALDGDDDTTWWAVRTGGVELEDDPHAVKSDARLTAVWCQGDVRTSAHAVMLGGTRLTVEGEPLLLASQPVNVSIELGSPTRLHLWANDATALVVTTAAEKANVFVDNQPAEAEHGDDMVAFHLPAGESQVIITADSQPMPRPAVRPTSDMLTAEPPDAPAFHPGVLTRASTSWTDGVDALDGNPNTSWVSLFGLPMPQWLEIELPEAEPMTRVELDTKLPCAGKVEFFDDGAGQWQSLGTFETSSDDCIAKLTFDRVTVKRLRITVERIDPANNNAVIASVTWSND